MKKIAKSLSDFKFRRLGEHFYGAKELLRFLYVRHCTSSEVRDYWRNKAGTHSKSANGRGARVALRGHPTHTDTATAQNENEVFRASIRQTGYHGNKTCFIHRQSIR
jgi:hypothetical protein